MAKIKKALRYIENDVVAAADNDAAAADDDESTFSQFSFNA